MQDYIIIAESGWIPEIRRSAVKGERIGYQHPFFRTLVKYSETPGLLTAESAALQEQEDRQTREPDMESESGIKKPQKALSAIEVDELRKMGRDANIKNWHTMKPETLIRKLEELNHD